MEFESQSEDGAVRVVITGTREIKSLSIVPELFSAKDEDFNALEVLIMLAVNDALRIVKAANMDLTDAVTKSFNEQLGA